MSNRALAPNPQVPFPRLILTEPLAKALSTLGYPYAAAAVQERPWEFNQPSCLIAWSNRQRRLEFKDGN